MGRARDNWSELCRSAEVDDGLPTRTTHAGTFDKLWWWNRYVSITTAALVGRRTWPEKLIYVDLFAGPGVLASKAEQRRLPGSPMIAAHTPKPFDRLIFCEQNQRLAAVCEKRLAHWGASDRSIVVRGDCNQRVRDIAASIPPDSLTLAFIDPTGLHARFETLEVLTSGRSVDLLILFADRMDIVRNIERYHDEISPKLDAMLGSQSGWRAEWEKLENRSAENICRMFNAIYKRELRQRLGYTEFGAEVIKMPSGRGLYTILFASRHHLGKEFWEKSTEKTIRGNRLF